MPRALLEMAEDAAAGQASSEDMEELERVRKERFPDLPKPRTADDDWVDADEAEGY